MRNKEVVDLKNLQCGDCLIVQNQNQMCMQRLNLAVELVHALCSGETKRTGRPRKESGMTPLSRCSWRAICGFRAIAITGQIGLQVEISCAVLRTKRSNKRTNKQTDDLLMTDGDTTCRHSGQCRLELDKLGQNHANSGRLMFRAEVVRLKRCASRQADNRGGCVAVAATPTLVEHREHPGSEMQLPCDPILSAYGEHRTWRPVPGQQASSPTSHTPNIRTQTAFRTV